MIRRIAELGLLCLVALALTLSCPVVERTGAWGSGQALAAQNASSDGSGGSGQTGNDGGWFGYKPRPHASPVKVPEPSSLFSILMGAAGVVLYVRWRKKETE